ncbi:MAG TPA: lipopolysaccharide core heptose(II) kinase RfaY, partial [Tepidisphaeraceae bacterium]|nr:lipopolysaccharide core heptose(II) kinase RfaY [Tepidisphaeraceae bacterium]
MSALTTTSLIDPALDPGLPKSLFGYQVVDLIGQGAGSLIYVVNDPKTRQVLALKHVVRKTDKDDRFIEQLENEFEVGSQVSHPGLRKSLDYKATRTLLRRVTEAALVMELFDGVPLEQQLPRSTAEIVNAFIQTAQALHALHALGYVHCDLKPNNILRDSRGQVKVIDLGQTAKTGTVKKRIQ